MSRLTTIGFDADDTLWQNEQFFRMTEDRFVALLGEHGEAAEISGRLLEAEKRNLGFYGFGIKGFVLSMVETAIEVTRGQVSAAVIGEILAAGRDAEAVPRGVAAACPGRPAGVGAGAPHSGDRHAGRLAL
jgi:putative hydrolase of the HAD superfamily